MFTKLKKGFVKLRNIYLQTNIMCLFPRCALITSVSCNILPLCANVWSSLFQKQFPLFLIDSNKTCKDCGEQQKIMEVVNGNS